MKRLLLLSIVLLLVLPAAFAYHANAVFTSKHGEPFQLFINGRLINHTISNIVRLNDVPAGFHEVEVRMRDYLHVSGLRTRVYLHDGFETRFEVRQSGRSGKVHLREISRIPLLPLAPPVCNTPPPHRPYQPLPDDYYRYPEPRQPQQPLCNNLLDQYALDYLFQSIGSKTFESSKVTIAKQAVSGGSVLAEDVKRIMELFTYESSRVDFAKFAYHYTCDKQNYFIVNDAFEYSSSIDELNRYIRRPF
ncbi:MAG: DUF4476 domain-containing protein [Hymenobacteraceae bacterium]|nr:DUF4476 domain-containing protein [Hymenobacteraceae bacterium]MDX5396515.1 DUF4476 domain-containing protein [Hymenobacteraceae bacterium]MDX5443110.1 DUF4476 domain-containing protein [Hymenobacteraceae bacterium]MDX5512582.1 DUF4476 domain-containing protein [Hymenobacteraceae bacterium]